MPSSATAIAGVPTPLWAAVWLGVWPCIGHATDAPGTDAPANQVWTAILIDGESKQPLPGIDVRVQAAEGESPALKEVVLTTDAQGAVRIALPSGKATQLTLETPGWWLQGWYMVGDLSDLSTAFEKPIKSDPARPVTVTLWKGTEVTGRLLKSDGSPAPGVGLNAGVYINHGAWREKLGLSNDFYSFDHGDWPNWTVHTVTAHDGCFSVTVPPPGARSWIRIGTTGLGFSAIETGAASGPARALADFAPFEFEVPRLARASDRVNVGDQRLVAGVVLRGRVLYASGKPLPGIPLFTSGKRGPYAGRRTVSKADGSFEFAPMNPGAITLRPDARRRNADGEVNSRDVYAVFIPQEVTIPNSETSIDITVQAAPHIDLEFEWVDRRAKKGPVSYYGEFSIDGRVPQPGQEPVRWRGETEKIVRDGRELLIVKVPAAIVEPVLTLVSDQIVHASYEDDLQKAGPGRIKLGDVSAPRRRVIYGDEPNKN